MLKVNDLMDRHPHLLSEQDSLAVAVDRILASGYLGLPVIDEQRQLVGFLSEQDCIKALITDSYHCDSHISVKNMMRLQPLYISPQLSVLELAQILGKERPKIFPVVDEGHVVGLITRAQVMRALNEQLKNCGAV